MEALVSIVTSILIGYVIGCFVVLVIDIFLLDADRSDIVKSLKALVVAIITAIAFFLGFSSI